MSKYQAVIEKLKKRQLNRPYTTFNGLIQSINSKLTNEKIDTNSLLLAYENIVSGLIPYKYGGRHPKSKKSCKYTNGCIFISTYYALLKNGELIGVSFDSFLQYCFPSNNNNNYGNLYTIFKPNNSKLKLLDKNPKSVYNFFQKNVFMCGIRNLRSQFPNLKKYYFRFFQKKLTHEGKKYYDSKNGNIMDTNFNVIVSSELRNKIKETHK